MSEYLERTNASKPTFGDYVILEMKRYGVPNEYFIHEVMTHPFTSNSWRNVPIDACDPEEHLHDTSETVISVCTQGFHLSGWHIFNVRLSDVLPMKSDKWAWQESPLRSRIAELEAEKCETCVCYNTDSYKFYTYPCNECKHRARDSYEPLPKLPEVQE